MAAAEPTPSQSLHAHAEALLQSGNAPAALELLEGVVDGDGQVLTRTDADLSVVFARALLVVGRVDEAEQLLRRLIAAGTGVQTHALLIDARCALGRTEDALEIARAAVGCFPDAGSLRRRLQRLELDVVQPVSEASVTVRDAASFGDSTVRGASPGDLFPFEEELDDQPEDELDFDGRAPVGDPAETAVGRRASESPVEPDDAAAPADGAARGPFGALLGPGAPDLETAVSRYVRAAHPEPRDVSVGPFEKLLGDGPALSAVAALPRPDGGKVDHGTGPRPDEPSRPIQREAPRSRAPLRPIRTADIATRRPVQPGERTASRRSVRRLAPLRVGPEPARRPARSTSPLPVASGPALRSSPTFGGGVRRADSEQLTKRVERVAALQVSEQVGLQVSEQAGADRAEAERDALFDERITRERSGAGQPAQLPPESPELLSTTRQRPPRPGAAEGDPGAERRPWSPQQRQEGKRPPRPGAAEGDPGAERRPWSPQQRQEGQAAPLGHHTREVTRRVPHRPHGVASAKAPPAVDPPLAGGATEEAAPLGRGLLERFHHSLSGEIPNVAPARLVRPDRSLASQMPRASQPPGPLQRLTAMESPAPPRAVAPARSPGRQAAAATAPPSARPRAAQKPRPAAAAAARAGSPAAAPPPLPSSSLAPRPARPVEAPVVRSGTLYQSVRPRRVSFDEIPLRSTGEWGVSNLIELADQPVAAAFDDERGCQTQRMPRVRRLTPARWRRRRRRWWPAALAAGLVAVAGLATTMLVLDRRRRGADALQQARRLAQRSQAWKLRRALHRAREAADLSGRSAEVVALAASIHARLALEFGESSLSSAGRLIDEARQSGAADHPRGRRDLALARACLELAREPLPEALRTLRKKLDAPRGAPPLRLLYATALLRAGRRASAARVLDTLPSAEPAVLRARAWLSWREGHRKLARELLRRARANGLGVHQADLDAARFAVEAGATDRSTLLSLRELSDDRDLGRAERAWAGLLYAAVLRQRGEIDQADSALERAVGAKPLADPDFYHEAARQLSRRGQLERALAMIERALSFAPKRERDIVLRGRLLLALDRPDRAIDALRSAAERDATAAVVLARAHLRRHELARVRELLSSGPVLAGPTLERALVNGRLLVAEGKPAQALRLLRTRKARGKLQAELRLIRGLAYRAVGRAAAARREIAAAVKLAPDDGEALWQLARIERRRGRTKRARELLSRAVAADQHRREVRLELGQLLLRQEHYREAETQFSTVLRRDPTDLTALGGRARALVERRAQRAAGAIAALDDAGHRNMARLLRARQAMLQHKDRAALAQLSRLDQTWLRERREALLWRGQLLLRVGKPALAAEQAAAALARHEGDAAFFALHARACKRLAPRRPAACRL